MDWSTFLAFLVQGLIVLFILAVILFVGSAAFAAVRDKMKEGS